MLTSLLAIIFLLRLVKKAHFHATRQLVSVILKQNLHGPPLQRLLCDPAFIGKNG